MLVVIIVLLSLVGYAPVWGIDYIPISKTQTCMVVVMGIVISVSVSILSSLVRKNSIRGFLPLTQNITVRYCM